MSQLSSLPDYASLNAIIANHEDILSPAEAHGVFCGLLCATPDSVNVPYLSLVTDDKVQNELQKLFTTTREQFKQAMNDNTLSLNLLLPADDAPLAERIATLGQWAQGFLSGLGEGGLTADMLSDTNFEEILDDLAAIARINSIEQIDADSLTEEDERDFIEISEYISVAVLSIYTDILLLQQDSANDSTQA